MALYLVQHGKSLPKEEDPDKGLSPEGVEETERIAAVAKGYGVTVNQIIHSGKKRARQTAAIFEAALRPPTGTCRREGINPLDDAAALTESLTAEADLMIVGHLPFMSRLTACLITGAIDRPVFKFQNSGIVCLDAGEETGAWIIKWALMPNIG